VWRDIVDACHGGGITTKSLGREWLDLIKDPAEGSYLFLDHIASVRKATFSDLTIGMHFPGAPLLGDAILTNLTKMTPFTVGDPVILDGFIRDLNRAVDSVEPEGI